MGKLRQKAGLVALDLPTEAQWEHACRAGTATALNNGTNLVSTGSDTNMDLVGRYRYNGGSSYGESVGLEGATAAAGTYLANAWGLYDMHGNAWEWCLDWYGTYPGAVSDPVGLSSGSARVHRGGSFGGNLYAGYCRSANRTGCSPGDRYGIGFRLCSAVPGQ
jgi:formylglycine-generating enzyme required for sulfatase activity